MRQQRSSSNKGQRSIVLTTDALHLIFGITMYIENKKDYDMRCFLRGGNGFFDVNNAFSSLLFELVLFTLERKPLKRILSHGDFYRNL